jgi:outer membrane protein assembly factor BamB
VKETKFIPSIFLEPANVNSHIYGVDINTGRQIWKFPTMNMLDSSAAIASNMMLIGSRDGLLYVFGLGIPPSYIR